MITETEKEKLFEELGIKSPSKVYFEMLNEVRKEQPNANRIENAEVNNNSE